MLARYYEYNHINPIIELFISRMDDLNYRYYASDLMNRLMQVEEFDLDASIRKAMAILKITGVPLQRHFWCIYRSAASETSRDWKLSDLACTLVILSARPANHEIEEIQQTLLDYLEV